MRFATISLYTFSDTGSRCFSFTCAEFHTKRTHVVHAIYEPFAQKIAFFTVIIKKNFILSLYKEDTI